MQQLVIATRNKKKLKELKRLLKGLPVKIKGLQQVKKKIPKIKEDKDTFIGNAKKKASIVSKLIKGAIVLADDSGLVVRSLGGAPGVNSARYAGVSQNDDKNIAKLLKNMKSINTKRGAYFICTAVIARSNKIVGVAEGKIEGIIAKERRGRRGFGYDPVFIPRGYKKTFAQMKPAYKNRISHRAKAIKQAKALIGKITLTP